MANQFSTLLTTWKRHAEVLNIRRPSTEAEYDRLIDLIESIFKAAGANPERGPYSTLLDIASTYAHDWEEQHHPMPKGDPVNVLKFLIDEHGVSQADLVRAGITDQPTLSRILSGQRSISKFIAKRLGHHFKLSMDTFL
jgi:HTH-type transcriptional regulator / antitoxin HigA